MECACTVGVDIDGYCTLIQTIPRTANKIHKCNECRGWITKGQWYQREVIKSDGKLEVFKTCEHCWSIRQVFFSDGWYYSMIWELLSDFITECDGNLSVSCIKQLTPEARGRVLDLVEEHWNHDAD